MSDIYLPKCWVDLSFNSRVILDCFLFRIFQHAPITHESIFRLAPFKIFLRNNKSAINSTHDVHKVKCRETDSWCSKILPKVLKGRGDFQGVTAHDFHLIFFFDMGGSMRATNFFDGLFSWLVAAVVLSKVNLCWKKNKLMVFQEIWNRILHL